MTTSLSIGELASRTGVTPSTLRIWEERHGFPVPTRLGSGHRRYSDQDVALVSEVARLRDLGMRLDAAITAVRLEVAHQAEVAPGPRPRSVHAQLRRRDPGLPVHRLTKRTLIGLSHAIEDEFCARARDGHLFGLFQQARHFAPARARWRELALLARSAHVLADFAPGTPGEDDIHLVALPERSPLRREWAVVCDATEAPIVLSAWEVPGQVGVPEPRRLFEATWTLVPALVRDASRVCADAVAADPDHPEGPALVAELTAAPSAEPADPALAAAFFNRAVAYLDQG
jgi:MerR family transcriptional regulator, light-induced transcriptional regulator